MTDAEVMQEEEAECFSDLQQIPGDLFWEAYPVVFLAKDK